MDKLKTYRLDETLVARIEALVSRYGSQGKVIAAAITMLENATIEGDVMQVPIGQVPVIEVGVIEPSASEPLEAQPGYKEPRAVASTVPPEKEHWRDRQERELQAKIAKVAASDKLAVLMDRKDIVYDPEP